MHSFSYGSYNIGQIGLESVAGQAGVAHAVLAAQFRIHVIAQEVRDKVPVPNLVRLRGAILDASSRHIADFEPDATKWYRSPDFSLHLRAVVSFEALTILNESRKQPRDVVPVTLRMALELDGAADWLEIKFDAPHRFSASDWIDLLENVKHSVVGLVEVPLAGELPKGFEPVATFYRKAIEQLGLCQWDNAIADCRQVLDEVEKIFENVEQRAPWAEYSNKNTREVWSFEQRLNAIRTMIRHATHEVHHGGHDRRPEEARLIVNLVGVALKFYAARLT